MRVCLTIRYSGTPFFGWQIQKDQVTVQATIQDWASRLYDQSLTLVGASRTDRGVHARGQLATMDIPDMRFSLETLTYKLNKVLAPHIYVDRIQEVPQDFFIHKAVHSKSYIYNLCSEPKLKPFGQGAYFVASEQTHLDTLNSFLNVFEGTHDFKYFANTGTVVKSTVRTIFSAKARRFGPYTVVRIHGSGFLKQMVRNMVGVVLSLIEKGDSSKVLEDILIAPSRDKRIIPAPAHALTLMHTRLHT